VLGRQKWDTSLLFILYISIRLFKTLALKTSSLGNMFPPVARRSSKASTLGSTTMSYFFSHHPHQPKEEEFLSWGGPEFAEFRGFSDMPMLSGAASADVATETFLFEDTRDDVKDIESGAGDFWSPYTELSGSDTARVWLQETQSVAHNCARAIKDNTDHSEYALGLGLDEEAFPKPLCRPFSGLHLDVHGEIPGENDAPAAEVHTKLHGELQSEIHSEPEAHSEAELKEEDEASHEEIGECEKIEKTELEHRLVEQKAKREQLQKSMTMVQLWGDFFLSGKSMLAIAALDEEDVQKAAFKVFGEKLSAEDVEWMLKKICETRREITMLEKRDARKKRVQEKSVAQNDGRMQILWCGVWKATKYVAHKAQLKQERQEQVQDSRENTFVREWGIWLLENKTKNFVKKFGVQDLKDAATHIFGRVPMNVGEYHLLGKKIVGMQLNMLWQKKRADAKKSVGAKKVRSHAAAVAAAAAFDNT